MTLPEYGDAAVRERHITPPDPVATLTVLLRRRKELRPTQTGVGDDVYERLFVTPSGALSRVAEDFPDSVAHVTQTFIELLSDADPRVRENACWALGYLAARDATSPLENRAHGDENGDVRTRAS